MNFQEFRAKSPGDFGLAKGHFTSEASGLLLFRWPFDKESLRARGLDDPVSRITVERVALAFTATTKPAPRSDWPTRCLDVCLTVPSFIRCGSLEAIVRISRHEATSEPMVVTAFVRGVTGERTREIFAGLAASLHDFELVSLADRMSRLAYVNGQKR
jgi:hypothetical protein